MNKPKVQIIHEAILHALDKADELAAQVRPFRRRTIGTTRAYNEYVAAKEKLDRARRNDGR